MSHFICPACKGASNVPKICETQGCEKEGQRLAECTCADGHHSNIAKSEQPPQETMG